VTRVIRFVSVILAVFGCSAMQGGPDLITDRTAEVEIEASHSAYIDAVHVRRIDGTTEITGRVRSKPPPRMTFPGHISISIIAADEKLVDTREVPYELRFRPRKPMRVGTFRAVLPYDIKSGTRVRLAFHHGFLKRAHRE